MKTFFMIKPDGIKRNLIGEIITRVEEKGFKILQRAELNYFTLSDFLES